MSRKPDYPIIDMQQTGMKIKYMLESAGYTPRIIQEYLHLSCVQPVYRWYKGVILPSLDHLFALSELLNVHMEELLVKKSIIPMLCEIKIRHIQEKQKRVIAYHMKINKLVA